MSNNSKTLGQYALEYEKGKVLVKFNDLPDKNTLKAFVEKYNFHSFRPVFSNYSPKMSHDSRSMPRYNAKLDCVYEFSFEPNISPVSIAFILSKDDKVEYSEPSLIYRLMDEYVPNDPLLNQQGWLNKIDAKAGWAVHKGNPGVIIAIVDAGIHFRHPDLEANVYYNHADPINGIDDDGDGWIDNFHGWDLIGESDLNPIPDNDPQPVQGATTQFIGHGTWVAGIASAMPDNEIGIAGTGFNCKFLPIKVSADFDSEGFARIFRAPEAVYIAAEMGASIINCSFGSVMYSQVMQDVIKDVTLRKNALVVAAAGNEPAEIIFYPAGYDYVLSVTGTDANDAVQTTRNLKVDVSAPGYAVTTSGLDAYITQGIYTSYSAPMVSGIAGIVRSYLSGLNAVQVAERIRATAKDISASNPDPALQFRIGKGLANLYRALTINSPAIRVDRFSISDRFGNPIDPGDTLFLSCTFMNYLSPTSALNVSISVLNNPFLTVLSGFGATSLGVINTLATKTQPAPFRIAVSSNAPSDLSVQIRIRYQDGFYDDFEVITFVINPTYLDVVTTNVQTGVGSTGRWGFNDSPVNTQGKGFIYNGKNILFQGGLILGRSTLQGITVADNIRQNAADMNTIFTPIQLISGYFPGPRSDKYTLALFTDSQADSIHRINLTIKDESFAFDRKPYDNFIIKRYVFRNRNSFLIQNFFVGLFADWDINSNSGNDNSNYDPIRKIPYIYSNSGDDSTHAAIVSLIESQNLNIYFSRSADFNYSDSLKFVAISNGINYTPTSNQDLLQIVSVGPLNLLPFDSVVVAFAIVCGDGFRDLSENIVVAKKKYACIVNGSDINPAFPREYFGCDSIQIDVATSGVVRYRWEHNESNSSVVGVNTSGIYNVILTDANDCERRESIIVNLSNMIPQPQISRTEIDLSQPDKSILLTDNTLGAISWRWDFGNGYGATTRTATATYHEPGFYNLSLVVSDGVCEKTFQTGVTVYGINEKFFSLDNECKIFPNPSNGKFKLHFPKPINSVSLYSPTGNKINTIYRPDLSEVIVASPIKGIYLLEIVDTDGNTQRKPIVVTFE
jgi:PKD repeat protein